MTLSVDTNSIKVSTPGRICLFGEHQDYLGLPVIAAAISRRIQVATHRVDQRGFRLNLPDINDTVNIPFDGQELPYPQIRDYFRSAVNVLLREGFTFQKGIEGEVHGNIPINSGTSSSSALLVSWLNVLTQLSDQATQLSAEQIAELAYMAEVLEFGEPGGMMDHYSTAVGNVIYLESQPKIRLEKLTPPLGAFVLGDSQEPKDTIGILSRVKVGMLDIIQRLKTINPSFALETSDLTEVSEFKDFLTKDEFILLKGNLSNRDILRDALSMLRASADSQTSFDHVRFGQLLNDHQANLRDAQRISTPKINRMIDAALSAGALGGKINGSGGGGCMFVYAPDKPEAVAEAIEREGGKAFVINVAEGTSVSAE
ncbi:mevalonate kinase family protein [Spirosoma linguale]|uniref:GHMP kinase domain protein n=1 Tax=Spirosoma linguale (strain ATCC 33905 / DSM 74 / LMG 10896 / Claus 1) TaxID=504472 RepID=D2QJ37_SPILD|nr:GHMP kinase domain protein [Spirosoma linguale DSM 74]